MKRKIMFWLFREEILLLLTACVSATWMNNGYSLYEAQKKYDSFLEEININPKDGSQLI